MTHQSIALSLTARQAEALWALASREDLPPETYATEVLVKHLYHAYTPEVAEQADKGPPPDRADHADRAGGV